MTSITFDPPLPSPLSESELQYLRPTKETTWSHSQWCDAILRRPSRYGKVYITKVEHMKDFHNSDVFHEFLRLTIIDCNPQICNTLRDRTRQKTDDTYLFVERMQPGDQVVAGWTAPGSDKTRSFSRADLLYSITVPWPGVPITMLAEPLRKANKALGGYLFIGRNCYTFARMVYDDLLAAAKELYPAQRDTMECAELYHEHRAVFGELFVWGVGITNTLFFWVRAAADEQPSRTIQGRRWTK
jgi:hypothetical protein